LTIAESSRPRTVAFTLRFGDAIAKTLLPCAIAQPAGALPITGAAAGIALETPAAQIRTSRLAVRPIRCAVTPHFEEAANILICRSAGNIFAPIGRSPVGRFAAGTIHTALLEPPAKLPRIAGSPIKTSLNGSAIDIVALRPLKRTG
jgi:hypothetical protein